MAVALRPCTLPGADEPSFDLPAGQMELGIGIHGERGTERVDALPAPELVRRLTDPIIKPLSLADGDRVIAARSTESRVGKECVRTRKSRWWRDHEKKNNK